MGSLAKSSILKIVALAIILTLAVEHLAITGNMLITAQEEGGVWSGWPQYLKNPGHTAASEAIGPRSATSISEERLSGIVGDVSLEDLYLNILGSEPRQPVIDENGTIYSLRARFVGDFLSVDLIVVYSHGEFAIVPIGNLSNVLSPILSYDQKALFIVGYNMGYEESTVIYKISLNPLSDAKELTRLEGYSKAALVGYDGTLYIVALNMTPEATIAPMGKREITIASKGDEGRALEINFAQPGGGGYMVYALSPETGDVLWEFDMGADYSEKVYVPAQLSNGKLVVVTDREMVLLNSDGTAAKTISLSEDEEFYSDPVVDENDNVYVMKFIRQPDNWCRYNITLVKYDQSLNPVWKTNVLGDIDMCEFLGGELFTPAYSNGLLYTAGDWYDRESQMFVGKFFVINATDGTIVRDITNTEDSYISPPIADRESQVYVLAYPIMEDEENGTISLYSYSSGASMLSFKKELSGATYEGYDVRSYILLMDSFGDIVFQTIDDVMFLKKLKPYTPPSPPQPTSKGGGAEVYVPTKPRYTNYLLQLPLIKIDYQKERIALIGGTFTYKIHVKNLGGIAASTIIVVHWPEDHYEYVDSSVTGGKGRLLITDLGRRILVYEIILEPVSSQDNSEEIRIRLKLKPEAYDELTPGVQPASGIIVNPVAILPTLTYLALKMDLVSEGYDLNTPDGIAALIENAVKEMALYNNEIFNKFLNLPESVQQQFLESMEGTAYEKVAQAFMITVVKEDVYGALDKYMKNKAEHSPPLTVKQETYAEQSVHVRNLARHGSLMALASAIVEPRRAIVIGRSVGFPKKPMEVIMYGNVAPEGDYWHAVSEELEKDTRFKEKTKKMVTTLAGSLWESFATGEVADTMFGELAGAIGFLSFGLVKINYAPFGNYECFYAGKKIGAATAAVETLLTAAAARFGAGATFKLVTKGFGKEPIHWGIDVITRGSRYYVDGTALNVVHLGYHTEFGWHIGLFSFGNFRTFLHLYSNRITLARLLRGELVFQEVPYLQLPRFLINEGIFFTVRNMPRIAPWVSPALGPSVPMGGEVGKFGPTLTIDAGDLYGPVGVRSIDPNDIMSYPKQYVLPGETVNFIVHFENLANATAPAYNITVTAYLDKGLNMSTLKLSSVSHPDKLKHVTVDNSTNTITWYFENIALPPNKNPPEGEGYVSFSINVNDTLPLGYNLLSYARIVFDYNPPLNTSVLRHIVDYAAPDPMEAVNVKLNGNVMVLKLNMSALDPGGSGVEEAYVRVDGGLGNRVFVKLNETAYEAEVTLSPNVETYFVDLSVKDRAGNVAHKYFKILNRKVREKVKVGNAVVEEERVVGKEIKEFDAEKCAKLYSEFLNITMEYLRLKREGKIALDIPLIPKGTQMYTELSKVFGEGFSKYPTYPGRIQLLYASLYKEFKECLGEE